MSAKKIISKNQKKINSQPKSYTKLLLAALILITVFVYFKSFNNQFITTWDDHGYVTENNDIRTLHGDSLSYTLKKTFSENVLGNYHPLTMLVYCIEYQKFKLNPKPYHVTNFILHLLNTLLVFFFIWLLTQQQWVAFITALLFAVHPMHVESVAWVSELKDVLYSFFYIAALCSYIFYLNKEEKKKYFYVLTLFLFTASLFSKAMAVSLPIAFFAIDYFIGRKITSKTVLEKVPFIVLSFIFGFIAIEAQRSASALAGLTQSNFFDRILFSCYGIMMYLWKLIVPMNLSCFYNYPDKQNGMLPFIFSVSPVLVAAVLFLIYKSQRFGKDVLFGFAFFFVTIVLVLQVLPVGDAVIADRYTYLPYIGLFFVIARLINNLIQNKSEKSQSLKTISLASLSLFSLVCCYLSIQRCKVWKDNISLWSDAIEKYDKAPKSINNRGLAYSKVKQYDKAFEDFNRTIELDKQFLEVYYNRGVSYFFLGKYDEAIKDYTAAIFYKPKFPLAFSNRGSAYFMLKRYDEAVKDYNTAIDQDSKFAKVYCDRAGAYFTMRKFQPALEDALKAQELGYAVDPHFIEAIQESIKNAKQTVK